MSTPTPQDVLSQVREAHMALLLAASRAEALGDLTPMLDAVHAAVGRARTLALIHPDLKMEEPAPRGAVSARQAEEVEALEAAIAVPSQEAMVVLRARADNPDDETARILRDFLAGRTLVAQPAPLPNTYELWIDGLAAEIESLYSH